MRNKFDIMTKVWMLSKNVEDDQRVSIIFHKLLEVDEVGRVRKQYFKGKKNVLYGGKHWNDSERWFQKGGYMGIYIFF